MNKLELNKERKSKSTFLPKLDNKSSRNYTLANDIDVQLKLETTLNS
jgi:hypothetical protein